MILDFIEQRGLGAGFVYKSENIAYYFDGTSFTQITDVDFPTETVRGLVYLDGTYYVMTPGGAIYGSDLENPTLWSSLNVIQAISDSDGGVALSKQGNLIVAFGDYSTEFFYDAANAVGSPLLPYQSSFLRLGCASAGSVCNMENSLIFMSQNKQKGRSIQKLEGTVPTPISNPYIDRILDADSLVDVTAVYLKVRGHGFYVLHLGYSDITLVYDFTTSQWASWVIHKKESFSISPVSATWIDGVATVVFPNHQLFSGDLIYTDPLDTVWGAGNSIVTRIDNNTFSYLLDTDPGIVPPSFAISKYKKNAFSISGQTSAGNLELVQDSTTGSVYALTSTSFLDGENPIALKVRTPLLDGDTSDMKFFSRFELIGDKEEGSSYVRYTDDDYDTWSKYREVNMNIPRSNLNRLGRSRRRGFEIVNFENTPTRLLSMDITVDKGFV